MRVAIVETAFSPLAEIALFEAANRGCGAIATFTGNCRAQSGATAVRMLQVQHYSGFTESEIERFLTALVARLALKDVRVTQRVGDILPGEAIVFVAAASPHRAEALAGVEALIDFLKTDAPLWKREISDAGAIWVEPTAQDYERRRATGVA